MTADKKQQQPLLVRKAEKKAERTNHTRPSQRMAVSQVVVTVGYKYALCFIQRSKYNHKHGTGILSSW